jgi:hypothetical protein
LAHGSRRSGIIVPAVFDGPPRLGPANPLPSSRRAARSLSQLQELRALTTVAAQMR